MLASSRVDTDIREPQALDWMVFDDVRLNDFFDIPQRDVAVPNRLRVHNHGWTVFTLVQAAGFVGPHSRSDGGLGQGTLKGALQFSLSRGIATPARMAFVPPIATYEYVFRKFGHDDVVPENPVLSAGSAA